MLEHEIRAGAPHLRESTPARASHSYCVTPGQPGFRRLERLIVRGENSHEALRHYRTLPANSLLDRSGRNPAGNPIAVMPRHGRLVDALVEQAALFETADP